MAKNIISVVAGYILWTVIFLGGAAAVRGMNPELHDENGFTTDTTILVIYLTISILASFASGFLTTKIAGRLNMLYPWILAGCLLATGIPVQLSAWNELPVWYNLAFLLLLVPVTIAGALAVKQK